MTDHPPPPVMLRHFVYRMAKSIFAFEQNMKNVQNTDARPMADWMRLFLSWMEWETEVHEMYWDE